MAIRTGKDRPGVAKEEMMTDAERVIVLRCVSPEEGRLILYIRNKRINKVFFEKETPGYITGDIYLARVKNTIPSSGAAYLDAGLDEPLFLNTGNRSHFAPANRREDSVLKPGDEIAVKVRSTAIGKKAARAICADEVPREEYIHKKAPCVLHRAPDEFEKSIRYAMSSPDCIWYTDDKAIYEDARSLKDKKLSEESTSSQRDKSCGEVIRFYDDESISIKALFDLRRAAQDILDRRVRLKSGAEIVIDRTEAMTVIDVNSASSRHDSVLALNLEAAKEVVYQIEARNLDGMILVDFVNMDSTESETILIEALNADLKSLQPAAKAEDITKLGIAEIVRPKSGKNTGSIKEAINSTILA
ncbi:MAG: ribonuclease E/G [Lachnospiraceae bacterium]|nr:ribonuclease E/G [Lachnospiraceae bacterium]